MPGPKCLYTQRLELPEPSQATGIDVSLQIDILAFVLLQQLRDRDVPHRQFTKEKTKPRLEEGIVSPVSPSDIWKSGIQIQNA